MTYQKLITDEERFWSKVDKSGDCWLWIAGTARGDSGKGSIEYGVFTTGTHKNQKNWQAHRYAYFITHGEIPEGLMVRHRCDVGICCRLDHLELGTHKQNMEDMSARKRTNAAGERNSQAKLTVEKVKEIKTLLAQGVDSYSLGPAFSVSPSCIRLIKQGRRWASVTI